MSFTFTRQRSSSVNSLSSNHSMTPCLNNSGASSGLSHPSTPVPSNHLPSQPHHPPNLPPLSTTSHPIPTEHTATSITTTTTSNNNTTTAPSASVSSGTAMETMASTNTTTSNLDSASPLPPPPIPSAPTPTPTPMPASGISTTSQNTSTTPILPPLTSNAISQKDSVTATPNSLRSMSIVSLDRSPRNSIISMDDNLRSHTRNNSTTSLVSLSGHSATHGFTHIHSKQVNGIIGGVVNSSAIISDDDSEFDSSTPSRTIIKPSNRFKRRSNSKDGYLKRDFKFKFDDSINNLHHTHQPPTSPTLMTTLPHSLSGSPTSSSSKLNDPISSPNSLTTGNGSGNSSSSSTSTGGNADKHLKKLKTANLMQQSMYIKRKLAISKDLQLEFYNSVSNNINNTNNNGLSSSLSAISSSTSPLSSTSNNPLSPLPPLSPPIISSELLDSKFFSPLLPNSMSRKSVPAPNIPSTLIPPNLPIMQTLQEQNELINKLNRKWNKSMINDTLKPKELKKDTSSDRILNNTTTNTITTSNGSTNNNSSGSSTNGVHTTMVNPRKRSRRILFDSDYDYESYDDYNYDIYDS